MARVEAREKMQAQKNARPLKGGRKREVTHKQMQ